MLCRNLQGFCLTRRRSFLGVSSVGYHLRYVKKYSILLLEVVHTDFLVSINLVPPFFSPPIGLIL